MNAANHMNEELLAMFAEGKLTAGEAKEVAGHVAECAPCLRIVGAVNETLRDEEREPWYRTRWLAIAAVVACAVVAGLFVFRTTSRSSSPVARLVELSPRNARPVEARLTGGFQWAPYRGPVRATESEVSAQQMKLTGAAGDLIEQSEHDRSPLVQHAAAEALVVTGDPQPAIDRLRALATASPANADLWNDLAAAEAATAARLGRPSLYPDALAATDRALQQNPKHPEALFNRAVILERLGLVAQARAAWQRYLEIDPSSPWAVEARERLSRIHEAAPGQAQHARAYGEGPALMQWGKSG